MGVMGGFQSALLSWQSGNVGHPGTGDPLVGSGEMDGVYLAPLPCWC
jgi:hypothetical protein